MKNLNLNDEQLKAIHHLNGPMVVIAGPGSGKTTVITHRVKNLVYNIGIKQEDILVITFTKAAVYNMEKMYNKIVTISSNINFCTFHSLFLKIIRTHLNIELKDIISENNKKDILNKIVKLLKFRNEECDEELLKELILEISFVINNLEDINNYKSKYFLESEFKKIFLYYENYKKENNKLDFDDIILKCYNLLNSDKNILNIWQNKFKYILIDEFQDINKLQYEIIKLICYPKNNLYIVGDDDQSIYSFRGSNPEILINFNKFFKNTKIIILNTNYRSTEEIIKISNKVISDNKIRYNKIIVGNNKRGRDPKILKFYDTNSEAINIVRKIKSLIKIVDINEICILYRTKRQSRIFVDTFMNFNLPYKLDDEMYILYNHWICKDICAYMKLAINRNDNISFEKIINKPKRYLNKGIIYNISKDHKSILKGLQYCSDISQKNKRSISDMVFHLDKILEKKPYDAIKYIIKVVGYSNYIKDYINYYKITKKGILEVLEELQENSKSYNSIEEYLYNVDKFIENEKLNFNKNHKNKNGITLSTMHGVKGLEFDTVFVVGCVDGIIPYERSLEENTIEEERRVFYVAITRAKTRLYISFTKTRYELEVKPTRFLNKIIKS